MSHELDEFYIKEFGEEVAKIMAEAEKFAPQVLRARVAAFRQHLREDLLAEYDKRDQDLAEFDKLTEDLLASYVPQDVAMECIGMLRAAGMGKEGHANTLWGMVKELLELYRTWEHI